MDEPTSTPFAEILGELPPVEVLPEWVLENNPQTARLPLLEALVWSMTRNNVFAHSAWILQRYEASQDSPPHGRMLLFDRLRNTIIRQFDGDYPAETSKFCDLCAASELAAQGRRGGSTLVGGVVENIPPRAWSGASMA